MSDTNAADVMTKQPIVIAAFDTQSYIGKRPRPLDYIFKQLYVDAVISAIHEVQPDYNVTTKTMPEIFDQSIEYIDRGFIYKVLHEECRELSQPAEHYDFELAHKLAVTEWQIELMLAVVKIVVHHDGALLEDDDVVVWDVVKQQIVVNRTVC